MCDMSIEIFDRLKCERDICAKTKIPSQIRSSGVTLP